MHFTREPIIETIITPRDGFRLQLRPSKGEGEEFFVDMVEVITFGKASFYRSLDKPKSFVIPTGDYDLVEVREARMVIKSATVEKVKIAGGKKEEEEKFEKKGRTKRSRKKKGDKPEEVKQQESGAPKPEALPQKQEPRKEIVPPKAESVEPKERRSLIPPPATLISESMARYKPEMKEAIIEETSE